MLMVFPYRQIAKDIPCLGSATSQLSGHGRHRHQGQRVDGRIVHRHRPGVGTSPYRTQSIRAESMVRAHGIGASFAQRP
jgi:hypothetical protein